jgi:hypothetical protein
MVAALLSAYYGARALVIQVRAANDENIQRRRDGKPPWPQGQRIFVHYIQSCILNVIGCFTGFIALFLAFKVYEQLGPQPKVETGTAVLLGFLGLLAITGVTGILPEMLQRGRVFGPRS